MFKLVRTIRSLERPFVASYTRLLYSTSGTSDIPQHEGGSVTATTGGFAQAYEKHTSIQASQNPEENHTFASLLRNSKLVDVSVHLP